eukprot:m.284932 g.284932  ORF g.284932 m.284932 type:complete len:564 (+) comp11263_c0_seq1:177-1868(+)
MVADKKRREVVGQNKRKEGRGFAGPLAGLPHSWCMGGEDGRGGRGKDSTREEEQMVQKREQGRVRLVIASPSHEHPTTPRRCLELPEGGGISLGASGGEGTVLGTLEVKVAGAEEKLGGLDELHGEVLGLSARDGDTVGANLPELAVAAADLAVALLDVHVEDLGGRLVALEEARGEHANKAVLAAEDKLGAVDELIHIHRVLLGRVVLGDQSTVLLDVHVLAVRGANGHLGAEPVNGEAGSRTLNTSDNRAIIGDAPEDVLAGADGPGLGGTVELNLEELSVGRGVLVGRDLGGLGRNLAAIAGGHLDLGVGVLNDEELVLGERTDGLAGLEGALAADSGEVEAVIAIVGAEGEAAAVELKGELGRGISTVLEGTAVREELAVGSLEAVLARVEEREGEHGIIAPGNVLVAREGTVLEVDVALAVDVLHANLGVHGEADNPEAVGGNDLGEGIKVLAGTTGVVAVGGLEGPAAISLSLNLKGLIGALGLGVSTKLAGSRGRQVAASVGADVHDRRVLLLLEEEDLLALHHAAVGVETKAKALSREVLVSGAAETNAHSSHDS